MPTLAWLNDDEARKISGLIPYRLLEADPVLSYGAPGGERRSAEGPGGNGYLVPDSVLHPAAAGDLCSESCARSLPDRQTGIEEHDQEPIPAGSTRYCGRQR